MELFGILLSIPVAFAVSMAYCVFLARVLRRFDRLRVFVYAASIVVLGMFLVELLLLASLGAVGSQTLIGPAFYLGHLTVFLLGTPALANVLVLRPCVLQMVRSRHGLHGLRGLPCAIAVRGFGGTFRH